MTSRSRAPLAALLAAGLVFTTAAPATERSTPRTPGSTAAQKPKASPRTSNAPGEASMVVVRDAETGALRAANADELRELQEVDRTLARGAGEDFKVVVRPDGSKMVDLKGHFMSLAVARTEKGGKVSYSCVDSAGEAKDFLTRVRETAAAQRRTPAPAQALEER